jgi:hypothetical protein
MSRHQVDHEPRRPQPVLQAGQVSALATVLSALLVSWLTRRGLLVPDGLTGPVADLLGVVIVAAAGALSSLWAALWARRRVTPVADPRASDGTRLRPAPQRARPAQRPYPPWLDDVDTDVLPAVVDVAALRREYGLDGPP